MKQIKKVRVMKMKKLLNSCYNILKSILNFLYKIIDIIIITPLSKIIYFISDKLGGKNGAFDKIINNPNSLIYISLIFAFACFIAVDLKAINFTETESIVLTNQPIIAEYNEEAYVI